MKVLLVAHGYPPELVGGTEKAVQGLAHALVALGHEVVVVAGSMQYEQGFRTSQAEDALADGTRVRVRRIHRADLYFDHWQKSASARVARAFRALVAEERPDVVHVHHWIRLTRDLVAVAARERVPAVVTLHDLWTTCLIAFRVRPGATEFCEAPLAASPCLACAGSIAPRTPWVPAEEQRLALARHKADVVRELLLARAVVVPSRAHAHTVARFLGLDEGRLALRVVPHGRALALARASAPPPPGPGRALVLAAWGHVHPLKGTDLLLEALRRAGAGIELEIAGGEPDAAFAARVKDAARDLAVRFHGPFDADALDRHPLARAHAMVSATRAEESWGLVLDEAAALGLPMVLPRSGAFPERLREGEGALFVAPRDPAALAAALVRLRDEPGLVASLRARLPAASALAPAPHAHAERLLALYEEARRAGPPEAPDEPWWEATLRLRAEEAWDASLARASAEELGFA